MDGFDLIAELDREGTRRLVRAYWKSEEGGAAFAEFEKEVTAIHRVWPPLKAGEDPEDGLALWVRYKATRIGFPAGNPFGLDPGERVDAAIYASTKTAADARLWIALTLDARLELRYPGELGQYRKFGDFISTQISVIASADVSVSRGTQEGNDGLFIDPKALILRDTWFFDSKRPPAQVVQFVNKLIAQLLRILAPKPIPVSIKLDSLASGAEINPAGPPEINYRSYRGASEVTSTLTGDDRFGGDVETIIIAGTGFGFRGEGHRNPEHLADRTPRLVGNSSQHLALSISAWVFRYFEKVHLENMIRGSYNDAIIKQKGEPSQGPGPLRHPSPYGWAMLRVTEEPKGFTDRDDDNVIILHKVEDLTLANAILSAKATIQQIQRGLFGIDFLEPDINGKVYASIAMDVEAPGQQDDKYEMLKPVVQHVYFERTDNILVQALGALLSIQDLFGLAITAIGELFGSGNLGDRTKNAAINFLISFAAIFAPMFLVIVNIFAPGLFGNLIGPILVPSIKFFGTDNLITLLFKVRPIRDGAQGGKPYDEGLTVYAQLRLN